MDKTQACYPAELRELADAGVGLAAWGENESAHCWLRAAKPWGDVLSETTFPKLFQILRAPFVKPRTVTTGAAQFASAPFTNTQHRPGL